MTPSQLEQIRTFAQEVCSREGCVLYDLDFHDGPARALRVYIDKENGVSIEDCANVSRALNLRLDVEEAVPGGHYDLEVSSPGLERKLTQLWHFEKAVGQTVQLKYADEQKNTKTYEGKLVAVEGSQFRFENSKGPFALDFGSLNKARVLLVSAAPVKPGHGKKKKR